MTPPLEHSPERKMASEWQPIETAPRDGTEILVWDGDRVCLANWDDGWWVLVEYTLNGVTHWQPLPKPPEELA